MRIILTIMDLIVIFSVGATVVNELHDLKLSQIGKEFRVKYLTIFSSIMFILWYIILITLKDLICLYI